MRVPPRQIGWGIMEINQWITAKQVEKLIAATLDCPCPSTTSTTTTIP